jgi:hypothetical protein
MHLGARSEKNVLKDSSNEPLKKRSDAEVKGAKRQLEATRENLDKAIEWELDEGCGYDDWRVLRVNLSD